MSDAVGNIRRPAGVGPFIGFIALADTLGKESYKTGDFEVQSQLISDDGRRYDINYYSVKADGTVKKTATFDIIVVKNR